jgi:hypothetical protein
MTKKKSEVSELELITEDEAKAFDAEASLMMNPYVRWAKFILTDDQPNGNNERVPVDGFDNLIQSGIHMPIKMAEGKIEKGHENSSPIGVITHLKKVFEDGVNKIVGLAALWLNERPGDVSYLKTKVDNGEEVDISWELGVSNKVRNNDGTIDLIDPTLKAATVVGVGAYFGRARITAMAAKKTNKTTIEVDKWGKTYVENLPDSSFLMIDRGGEKDLDGRTFPRELRHFPVKDDKGLYDESKLREALVEAGKSNIPTPVLLSLKKTVTTLLDKIEAGASLEEISEEYGSVAIENIVMEEDKVELEQLKQQVIDLQAKLDAALASLQEKEQARASLETEKTAMETELAELQAFKKEIDDEVAKVQKLEGIKAKFAEAKLEKDDAYFTDNSEKLLSLDEPALDFMVQELAAFSAKASLEDDKTDKTTKVPDLPGEPSEVSISEIVKALKERKSK